jgi:hypothetical protein
MSSFRNDRVETPPPTPTTHHPPIDFDDAHSSDVVVTFLLHDKERNPSRDRLLASRGVWHIPFEPRTAVSDLLPAAC